MLRKACKNTVNLISANHQKDMIVPKECFRNGQNGEETITVKEKRMRKASGMGESS